jgi:heme oxygenase
LRTATSEAHDRLDRAMAALDLIQRGDYARFLRVQHAARAPIEAWCQAALPQELLPPSQLALIEADLADLGESSRTASSRPFIANADGALGIAWALGGSSLGNRAMLADLRKRGGAALPARFLSDGAMPAFFASLRPKLEQPIDEAAIAGAVAGAHAVFARFAEVAAAHLTAEAA